jgi:hypothetical protein
MEKFIETFENFNRKNTGSINEAQESWVLWKKEEGEDKASIYDTYDSKRKAETALFNIMTRYQDSDDTTGFNIMPKKSWDKLVEKGKVNG